MELTKESAKNYLKNKKVFCLSDGESEAVQKKLFEIGFTWGCYWHVNVRKDKWALFTSTNEITHKDKDIVYWECQSYKSISVSEILNIKLIDIPKFNLLTLQPFDKVLVRLDDDCNWGIEYFERYVPNDDEPFYCLSTQWGQCIPYNEDVKHLIGTKDNPPEYYITWK